MQETQRRFFLIRHGVTLWNKAMRFQGHTDIALDEEGHRQAAQIASRLTGSPIVAVYSSDLSRAHATALAISGKHNLPVLTTPELRETGLGQWEGLTRAEIEARGEGELLTLYLMDSARNRPPQGEPLELVFERLSRQFEQIATDHPAGDVVIVGHGGSLRALLCYLLEAPQSSMRRFWLDNASLTTIEERVRGGLLSRRILSVNDTSHLLTDLPEPLEPNQIRVNQKGNSSTVATIL